MANRLNSIASLSSSMPGANQRVADGLNAARTIAIQQGVKSGQGPMSGNQIQQTGAQVAQQVGQQTSQIAKESAQTQGQLAQTGLMEQRRLDDQQLFARQKALQEKQGVLVNQLSSISESVKDKVFDSNLSFKRDELGRTVFNERQLADWAITKAKNQQQLAVYEQTSRQLSERRIKMLEVSIQKVKQHLTQGFDENQQELDQATKKRLLIAKQELEKKIAREKAKAGNRAAMYQAGGTVLGAAAGAAITGGTPVGAVVGASIGGGLGSLTAGLGG